jgi:hypothetical protein
MKADLGVSDGGPEREALRAFLRHWHVAGPPPGVEEDLRLTFRRRRRSRRRPVGWLAFATGLVLVAASQLVPARRPVARDGPVAVTSPRTAPSAPPGSQSTVGSGGVAATPPLAARVRRAPVASHAEPEVVVEPGQARLLRRLGRELRALRPAETATTLPRIETVSAGAPEAPIPRMRETELPSYRAEWELVAGEWPFVHRYVPAWR